jgi:hypothetical protein
MKKIGSPMDNGVRLLLLPDLLLAFRWAILNAANTYLFSALDG